MSKFIIGMYKLSVEQIKIGPSYLNICISVKTYFWYYL